MRKSPRHRYIEIGKKGQRHMMLVMEDVPRRVKINKRQPNQWNDNPTIVVEESSDQDEQGGSKHGTIFSYEPSSPNSAVGVMPDESWLHKLQTAISHELFLICLSNSNMLVKGEGGDFIFENQNADDDQISDDDGVDRSDKSHTDSDEKDKDEDRVDGERQFFSKSSAMKKDVMPKESDNDNDKYAVELEAESLISIEEHLVLLENRLIEEISAVVREELMEFKRLFMALQGSTLDHAEERYYAAEINEPTAEEYLTMLESWIIDQLCKLVRQQVEALLRLVTPPESPEPDEPTGEDFGQMFKCFAKLGDLKGAGDLITLSNSDRWWKQAKVIDGRRISTTDTGIYFRKIAKTKRTLTFRDYQLFVEGIAKSKKIPVEEIRFKLCNCSPPTLGARFQTDDAFGARKKKNSITPSQHMTSSRYRRKATAYLSGQR